MLNPFSFSYSSLSITPLRTLADSPIPAPISASASVAPIFFDCDNTKSIILKRWSLLSNIVELLVVIGKS